VRLAARKAVIAPFTFVNFCGDPTLLRACVENFTADKIARLPPALWRGTPYRHDKIRIAYVSADFREHAVGFLVAGLIESHDRARFEITGISLSDDDGGAMRARFAAAFDHFHEMQAVGDAEVAALLKEKEIDIAVDLMGHTQGSRPGIFAHRPAPVQVQYLGYPGSMGAGFIDYTIADAVVAPFADEAFFREKIVQLPDCYQVNDDRLDLLPPPSRREAGLPEEGFVFCCFNNSRKITAPMFDIWMRLLQAVPHSVLWLVEEKGGASAHLQAAAMARGVDPARLIFAPRRKLGEHLARHRLADLFLDTLPYNAHATASFALWAGVPLVTCRGSSFAGRVATSLLQGIGLPELSVENLEAYEALALKLARDPAALRALRARLEQNRATQPLFDTFRFTRNLEAAYTSMWQRAERGEPPRSFAVPQINQPPGCG
jgi:protein O-GlcNAc transferase